MRMRVIILTILVSFCMTKVSTASAEPLLTANKESKKSAKNLQKEGWKVFGSSKSLQEVIEEHYRILRESNGKLMPMESRIEAKDVNHAIKRSQTDIARQRASMEKTTVAGDVGVKMVNVEGDDVSSHVRSESHVRTSSEHRVKAQKPSAVFYRSLSNGNVEVIALYLVNVN